MAWVQKLVWVNEPEEWEEEDWCKQCDKNTLHKYHSECHERDSSGDYKECTICKLFKNL